jgi:uncharacterized protein YggE
MSMKLTLAVSSFLVFSSCAHRVGTPRAVNVQGQCFREVAADRGQVDLTTVVLEKDIESATRIATEKYTNLKAQVEALRLQDLELKTAHYSVQERRDWVKDRQVSRGFEARMTLRVVSSQIARMGEVLQAAGREGVQDVGALQTYVSTARRESERTECLKQAVLDARGKAQGMLATLDAGVGRVLQVSEEGAAPMPSFRTEAMDVPMMAMAKGMRGAPAPQVEGGKEEFRYSVSVSFEIR